MPAENPLSPREGEQADSGKRVLQPQRRRRRRKNVLPLFFGLLVVSICGLFLWRHFASFESTDDAQVDAHLYPVSARISGHFIRVNVGDNEYVQEGTVLVEIDPTDYQVAVDQARADLHSAEATAQSLHIDVPITETNTSSQVESTAADIEKAQAGIIAAEKQSAAADAELEEAVANDVKAQHDEIRYKMLVDKEETATTSPSWRRRSGCFPEAPKKQIVKLEPNALEASPSFCRTSTESAQLRSKSSAWRRPDFPAPGGSLACKSPGLLGRLIFSKPAPQ